MLFLLFLKKKNQKIKYHCWKFSFAIMVKKKLNTHIKVENIFLFSTIFMFILDQTRVALVRKKEIYFKNNKK